MWLSNLYEWFWKDLLHLPKPITHMCQDFYHDLPLITLFVWGAAWYAAGKYIGTVDALEIAGWVFLGIILGHFFWAGNGRDTAKRVIKRFIKR